MRFVPASPAGVSDSKTKQLLCVVVLLVLLQVFQKENHLGAEVDINGADARGPALRAGVTLGLRCACGWSISTAVPAAQERP